MPSTNPALRDRTNENVDGKKKVIEVQGDSVRMVHDTHQLSLMKQG